MRTFYVFNINKEFSILTKDSPYNLYKTLENVYYLEECDLSLGMNIFDQVAVPFQKIEINKFIYNSFKDNDFYTMFNNKHKMYNKYKDELLNIKTYNTHLLIKTNISKKNIFENICINNNLFVCDFKNKDYFWIEKILS